MDDVKFEFEKGCLSLRCSEALLSRLRDVVITESQIREQLGQPIEVIRWIQITAPSGPVVESRLRDRVALVGCATVAFLVMSVFAIGVATIVGWLQ